MTFVNLANSREEETENSRNARTPFALRNNDRCILRCALLFRQHFSTISAFNSIPFDGFCTIKTSLCSVSHFLYVVQCASFNKSNGYLSHFYALLGCLSLKKGDLSYRTFMFQQPFFTPDTARVPSQRMITTYYPMTRNNDA